MMLRNRSRAVTSKQAIMSDGHTSLPSPTQNHKNPSSSFLGSPKFFGEFLAKGLFESEAVMSPNSILDNKQYSILGNNPFALDKNLSKPPNMTFSESKNYPNEILESEGVGLALIDSLNNERHDDDCSKTNNSRMVLLGSKLKIQIPPLPPSTVSTAEKSPKSPADFGIKTPNSHKLAASLSCALKSGNPSPQTKESPQGSKVVSCNLSLSEMELSEEYTCVISHGPNPRTTHIYDNCIVESCCGVVGLSKLRKQYGFTPDNNQNSMSMNFLSSCYRCKKKLGEGKDIYMYRGEKAFCSHECRCQEMLSDGMENPEPDCRSTNCT